MPVMYVKLRSQKRSPDVTNHVEETMQVDDEPISKGALAMRKHRAKLQQNEKLYEASKEAEKVRSRDRRANATEEQKKTAREKAKLRMRDLRAKRKLQSVEQQLNVQAPQHNSPAKSVPPLTRKGREKHEKIKEYNRDKKRISRAKQSSQKKRRERESNRARNAAKREETRQQKQKRKARYDSSKIPVILPSSPGFCSENARNSAVSRLKKRMPSSPRRYAEVVYHLNHHATPRRKKALKHLHSKTPPAKKQLSSVFKCLREVKSALRKKQAHSIPRRAFLRNFVSRLRLKYNFKITNLTASLGLRHEEVYNFSHEQGDDMRKKRSDATNWCTVDKVTKFVCRPDNAIELPHKKSVGASGEAKRVALMSQIKLYKKFQEENPDKKLCFSKFKQIRNKLTKVKTQSARQLVQCLCEYCTNVDLKLRAIHTLGAKKGIGIKDLADRYDVANLMMCDKEEEKYADLSCIDGDCSDCGTERLKEKLAPLSAAYDGIHVTWHVWEYRESTMTKGKKKRVLVKKTLPMKDLLSDLYKEMETFPAHLFHSRWQHDQYNIVRNNIPPDTVVMVMDFSENFSCFYQQEIQSAHWAKNVVTIHPVVAYYKCPEHNVTITEYLDFLTHDNGHDAHAVQAFIEEAITHLRESRGLNIKRIIQFTDGATHYKSRMPFCDISYGYEDFGIVIERHFFGSRHGKGPCDGEGGVVKSAASRAIINGLYTIHDAEDFYTFANEELAKPLHPPNNRLCSPGTFVRTFFHLHSINRERPLREGKTYDGTRALHSVRGMEGPPGRVMVRRLSCFCTSCESGEEGCINAAYTEPHKTAVVAKENSTQQRQRKTRAKPQKPVSQPQQRPASPQSGNSHLPDEAIPTSAEVNEEAIPTSTEVSEDVAPTSFELPSSAPVSTNEVVLAAADGPDDVIHASAEIPSSAPSVFTEEVVPHSAELPTSEPSNLADSALSWKCGDWVVVDYSGDRYPGTVVQVVGTETEVDCMMKKGRFWKWPERKDLLWYTPDKVVKILAPPNPAPSTRELLFQFTDLM